jgi:hypothetical protein
MTIRSTASLRGLSTSTKESAAELMQSNARRASLPGGTGADASAQRPRAHGKLSPSRRSAASGAGAPAASVETSPKSARDVAGALGKRLSTRRANRRRRGTAIGAGDKAGSTRVEGAASRCAGLCTRRGSTPAQTSQNVLRHALGTRRQTAVAKGTRHCDCAARNTNASDYDGAQQRTDPQRPSRLGYLHLTPLLHHYNLPSSTLSQGQG